MYAGIHTELKKQVIIFLPIISSNADRFSNLFHWDLLVNLQYSHCKISHHTLNVSLYYLVKYECQKTSDNLNKSSAVAEMGDRARAKCAEKWGPAMTLSMGRSWSPSNNVAWAETYLHTKWYSDPSNRLATIPNARNRDIHYRQTIQT